MSDFVLRIHGELHLLYFMYMYFMYIYIYIYIYVRESVFKMSMD